MSAILEVLTGPDQGKRFPLDVELVHIGTGAENHVSLSDPQLGEFHASLSVRGSQLSLYANESLDVQVGETRLPKQQWIPIPATTAIRLGGTTEVRIVAVEPALSNSAPVASAERRKPARKESKRQVARLITNRTTEAAVQLGTDGRYPELSLAHVAAPVKQDATPRESNPVLLLTVLAASCLSSIALVLTDFEGGTSPRGFDPLEARSQLTEFYGKDSAALEPYQKFLREASIDHSQGELKSERQRLMKVLDLLKAVDAKDPDNLNGLTGKQTGRGKASDQKLRALIETILAR